MRPCQGRNAGPTPADRTPMSAFALKLVAIISMVIDHIGLLFFPGVALFQIVGRLAFPLFAFFIAEEGFIKTRSVPRYATRLFLFALISQLSYFYFTTALNTPSSPLNIFFTLFFSLLTLVVLTKVSDSFLRTVSILVIAFIASGGIMQYGMYGLLSVAASYIFIQNRVRGLILLSALPLGEALRIFAWGGTAVQAYALASVPLIALYNGSRGKQISKWWFYWFYPLHLLALALVKTYILP